MGAMIDGRDDVDNSARGNSAGERLGWHEGGNCIEYMELLKLLSRRNN